MDYAFSVLRDMKKMCIYLALNVYLISVLIDAHCLPTYNLHILRMLIKNYEQPVTVNEVSLHGMPNYHSVSSIVIKGISHLICKQLLPLVLAAPTGNFTLNLRTHYSNQEEVYILYMTL